MHSSPKDPFAWFDQRLETASKVGFDLSLPVGLQKGGDIYWQDFDHIAEDGIGALLRILSKEGYEVNCVPQLKHPRSPSPWRKKIATARLIARALKKKDPIRWQAEHVDAPIFAKPRVHHYLFPEFSRLETIASKQRISTNSILLWAIDRATRKTQTKDYGPDRMIWSMPVNMRGGINRPSIHQNHSVGMPIGIMKEHTPIETHKAIGDFFRADFHWALVDLMKKKALPGTSEGDKKRVVLQDRTTPLSKAWAGGLTNLGKWPEPWLKGDSGIEAIYISPAVTLGHPISVGVLNWKDQLSISLRTHPMIGDPDSRGSELMHAFVEELENYN